MTYEIFQEPHKQKRKGGFLFGRHQKERVPTAMRLKTLTGVQERQRMSHPYLTSVSGSVLNSLRGIPCKV